MMGDGLSIRPPGIAADQAEVAAFTLAGLPCVVVPVPDTGKAAGRPRTPYFGCKGRPLRISRYCDIWGSGIDSCSGRSASAQPSVPSGYPTTLVYPMARIRFAAFQDIQQSRRQ